MGKITELLGKTTDKSKKDMAWLLNHGFELDEEQSYGYEANACAYIGKRKVTIFASKNNDSSEWRVSFVFDNKDTFTAFKFGNGETYIEAKRVKNALDKAYAEIMSVKCLGRALNSMKKQQLRFV